MSKNCNENECHAWERTTWDKFVVDNWVCMTESTSNEFEPWLLLWVLTIFSRIMPTSLLHRILFQDLVRKKNNSFFLRLISYQLNGFQNRIHLINRNEVSFLLQRDLILEQEVSERIACVALHSTLYFAFFIGFFDMAFLVLLVLSSVARDSRTVDTKKFLFKDRDERKEEWKTSRVYSTKTRWEPRKVYRIREWMNEKAVKKECKKTTRNTRCVTSFLDKISCVLNLLLLEFPSQVYLAFVL